MQILCISLSEKKHLKQNKGSKGSPIFYDSRQRVVRAQKSGSCEKSSRLTAEEQPPPPFSPRLGAEHKEFTKQLQKRGPLLHVRFASEVDSPKRVEIRRIGGDAPEGSKREERSQMWGRPRAQTPMRPFFGSAKIR